MFMYLSELRVVLNKTTIGTSGMFAIFTNDEIGAPPKTTFTVDSCVTNNFAMSAARVEIYPVYLV